MHAVTIRRMIVFGVCALGVGSLYLVPSIARSPEQLRLSGSTDEPTTSPVGAGPSKQRESSSPTGDRESPAGDGVASGDTAPDTQPLATHTRNRGSVKQRPPRTPSRPSQSPTSRRRRSPHDDSPSAGRRPATTSGWSAIASGSMVSRWRPQQRPGHGCAGSMPIAVNMWYRFGLWMPLATRARAHRRWS